MTKKPKDLAPKWPQAMMRPLNQIYPHPQNPKTHPPAQLALLAQILLLYGPDQPIVVDEDGVILKGHGRLESAKIAGMEDFPIVVRVGLSEADKVAMRIIDNQLPLLGGWDREIVRGGIASLKTAGYDVALLGFGDAELVQFETTPGPPAAFPEVGENLPTAFCCPACGHRWSGDPMAGAQRQAVAKRKAKDKRKKKR